MILSTKNLFLKFICVTLFIVCSLQELNAQVNQCPSCWHDVVRQKIIYNQTIPSTSIRGYVEFLPNGYNPNGTQKHPLLIHLAGASQLGSGNTAEEVCNVACVGAASKIEQNRFPETVIYNGVSYSFIVLSPQYNGGTSGDDLAAFINYAIGKYKIDPSRVYLTGFSAGGSFVTGYMSSSPANAKKIAAILPVAMCTSSNPAGANNIANQRVRFWGIHCVSDQTCGSNNTVNWATEINKVTPSTPMATANLTPVYNIDFFHDIFSTVYDIRWKTLPDNVFQKHITEWMIQYTSSAAGNLPATISKYDVLLKNKQVFVDWTTNLESNTDFFTIERAGRDMQFKQIGKLPAAGNSSNPISYSFFDPAPLKGTSFYRVVLMNKDGVPDIYEIKRIINREFGMSFSLSPVPSRKSVLLSFEIEESQKLNFSIRDINGRQLRVWSANFSSGAANIPINIEALAPGIYYLAIQGTQFNESQKFIKQ